MRLIDSLLVIHAMHAIEVRKISGKNLKTIYSGFCIEADSNLSEVEQELTVCDICDGNKKLIITVKEEEHETD